MLLVMSFKLWSCRQISAHGAVEPQKLFKSRHGEHDQPRSRNNAQAQVRDQQLGFQPLLGRHCGSSSTAPSQSCRLSLSTPSGHEWELHELTGDYPPWAAENACCAQQG